MKRKPRLTKAEKMAGIKRAQPGAPRTIAACGLEEAPDGGMQVAWIKYSDDTIVQRGQFTQPIRDQIAFWQRRFSRRVEEEYYS